MSDAVETGGVINRHSLVLNAPRRPRPRQTAIGDRRRLAVMLTMAVGSFAIGMTEFVSMGLLNTIAADCQLSEHDAGVIISAYAIGVVVGAPLSTVFMDWYHAENCCCSCWPLSCWTMSFRWGRFGEAVLAGGYSYWTPALAGVVLALAAMVLWSPAYLLRRRSAVSVGP